MQHECRITDLETKIFPESQKAYLANSNSDPCPYFKRGDPFLLKRTTTQDVFHHLMNGRFCGEAWDTIGRYVHTPLQCGSIMHGWTSDDRTMIACCNYGTRPVIFLLNELIFSKQKNNGNGCKNKISPIRRMRAILD